jgi:LacI family transcriptional regulator
LKPEEVSVAATQHDVAKLAGVSQSVVSRALSGGHVSPRTKARVLDACQVLGYVPDIGARTLVTGASNMVAVVVANIMNPFYPYIFDRLTVRIQSAGQEVLLLNCPGGRDVDEMLPTLLQYKVRGVIILTASLSSRMAKTLEDYRIPTVMLNRYSTMVPGHSVTCDNEAAARLVANKFVDAGYKTFGYVGGAPGASTTLDRRNGFLAGLSERGEQLLFALDGEFARDWGYEAGEFIKRLPRVEAVFCADDVIAMGLIDNLREAGWNIPSDLAIVGFDDVPSASWSAYSLTTVRQPVDEMVEETLRLLEKPWDGQPAKIRIPGEFISRQSFPAGVVDPGQEGIRSVA